MLGVSCVAIAGRVECDGMGDVGSVSGVMGEHGKVSPGVFGR